MSDVTDRSDDPRSRESARLAVLHDLGILDTPREAAFDDVVALATRLFRVPIAFVTFVDEARQWFKAEIGLGIRETALDTSVCAHAIREPDVFVVPDLSADPRFASFPYVAGEAGLRFYAGARIETEAGHVLGTVSIVDHAPRPLGLSGEESDSLQALARQVGSLLELRLALADRDRAVAEREAAGRRHALVADATSDAIWDWDIETDRIGWNEAMHDAYGYALDGAGSDRAWWLDKVHPEDRERVGASMAEAVRSDASRWTAEYRFRHADGGYAEILDRGSVIRDETGRARRMVGAMLDLTERNRASARRGAVAELAERLRDLQDPDPMFFAAAEIMGRTLQIDRAGYARVDADREMIFVERDWLSGAGRSFPGALHFRDFGSFIEDLKSGQPVIVQDVRRDPRTAEEEGSLAAIGVRALVNLPIVEQGRLVAIFYLNHGEPRAWTEGDIAFLRNVTESARAAAERARSVSALRASEELFRVFAQAMPNQVWAANPEGGIDWLNQRVDEYFGPPEERGVGVGWAQLLHPDDVAGATSAWRHAVAEGEIYETEFRLRRRDGVYRWFLARALPIRDERGAIRRWIGTNTDVDEQKVISAELEQANNLLSTRVEERTRERDRLWSTTNDLMGTAGLDGYLTSVNPAWTRMLGWSEAELLSRPSVELVDAEDRDDVDEVARQLQQGDRIEGLVNRLRAKDGSTRTVMWNAVPDRGVVYFVGRDITDQRQVEEQLRQAQKMEAVGQLTGGIAHDFNNLLTGIIGSLDLLQTRMRQGRTEKLDRYLEAATTSAKRAASLTHRLLAFARRQPLDPRAIDAAALVRSLEDLLRRTIGEKIGLRIVCEPDIWPILCDPNQLESAILNLAINARDAMPDGGELTIEAANTFLDGVSGPVHDGIEPGPFVRISVSDNGTGMPSSVLKRAFDPFFTTKPLGQGTGLGLSMVYGFARQSEGAASIASTPNRGTSVTIFLPRHRGDAVAPAGGESSPATPPATREETVLVVEDELIVRNLVVEVLSEMGLTVLQAADGPSGLKVLASPERIDLLVSDLGLPGINGRQMVDEGRGDRPGLRVLFITGYAENAAMSGFLQPGMEILAKPFSVEALVSRVRAMLDG